MSSNSSGGLPPPPTPEELAALPHDNAGMKLNVSIWVMVAVSALFLSLRVYCKYLRHKGLWWDDYVLIASWICMTIESCLLSAAVGLGYGLHIWDFPITRTSRLLLLINAAGSFSVTAAIWSKTSFAFTLLRLTEGWTKVFVWCVIVSMNVAMGLSALFVWIQCTPVSKTWEPFSEGTCWPQTVLVYYDIFSAAYSAAMDITLALLPWKLVWRLQMRRKERVGVALAMSMGVFAGITAIIKTTKIPSMLSLDFYDSVDLFIWGNAESTVTIIAASIPILRVLIREVKSSARRYYVATAGEDEPVGGGPGGLGARSAGSRKSSTVVISANGGGGREKSSGSQKRDDDGSDRSILREMKLAPVRKKSTGKIHVVQISEVAVEYSNRDYYELDRV